MLKKSLILFFVITFFIPIFTPKNIASAVDFARVCGMDGKNYKSADDAELAEVDVAYNFACVNPTSEKGLYEAMTDISFTGALIEVGSTDVPTNLIVRNNKDAKDYTVAVTAATVLGQKKSETTGLSDWLPGDQIKVIGKKNENTGNIDPLTLINLSITLRTNKGANGWITKIDKEIKKIIYKWSDKEYVFAYDDSTKFVVGLKNPATVDDLSLNDRIRVRLQIRNGQDPLAKIVVVLRRSNELFMKIRTFTPRGTLVRMDSTVVPTTIQIKIEKTPGLKTNDVNNLIGQEGTLVTVNVTEDTLIVRKYFGKTTLAEFSVGDSLMIVGRVNDDGTMDAKLIKNNSIWKISTKGHAGLVKEVNTTEKYLMVEWTPIAYLNSKKLKEVLKSKPEEVSAQSIASSTIEDKISERISRIKSKIAEELKKLAGRIVRYKRVAINRILHNKVSIGDLITRGQPQLYKIVVTDNTRIVIGTNVKAVLSDIKVGDKVRIRGVRQENPYQIIADSIMVVSSLPEIDEPLATPLDDINEIVSEISTESSSNLATSTITNTEQEVNNQ